MDDIDGISQSLESNYSLTLLHLDCEMDWMTRLDINADLSRNRSHTND